MVQKAANHQNQSTKNTEGQQMHLPSADFLKLIRILWEGKWFFLIFCAVFTFLSTFLSIYFIEPVYKTSATFSISSLSIPEISNYLESSAFRTKLLNSTTNQDEDQTPFSFFARALYSTPEKRVGALDIFWESHDPENAYSNLAVASELIRKFVTTELKTPQQLKIDLIEEDMSSMKADIEKLYQQSDQKCSLALVDLAVNYAIKKDNITQLKYKDVLRREIIAVKQPQLPAAPYKPNRLQIFSTTFLTSIALAVLILLFRFQYRKKQ